MEDKLKREAKDFVQKLFKKQDRNNAGAIHKNDIKKIIQTILPEFSENEELEELLKQHVKVTKYTTHNKKTNQFDVQFQEDTLDFPSVLAICIHFLMKIEMKNANNFAGQSVVKYSDFPKKEKLMVKQDSENKKRLF